MADNAELVELKTNQTMGKQHTEDQFVYLYVGENTTMPAFG